MECIRRMALGAVCPKVRRHVAGVCRGFKVRFMAGKTVRRGRIEIPADMAFRTIIDLVAFCQREKIVCNLVRRPVRLGQ